MDNKKYQNIVESLVKEHKEVLPLFNPEKRSLLIFAIHPLLITIIMFLIQPFREGFLTDLTNVVFLLEVLSGAISLSALIYSSFLLVIPGRKNKTMAIIGFISFLILSLLIAKGIYFPHKEASMLGKRHSCLYEILILGILPFAHITYLCKKAYIQAKFKTLLMASCASALIPAILMHLACMYEPIHVLKYHISPIIFFTITATTIAWLILKKGR